jgi:dCTP diphosphatase
MLSEATRAALLAFRHERDWEQFHTPKNLAIAISVEAGELLEQFQWTSEGTAPPGGVASEAVLHEIADVAILLTYLATDLGVDIDAAVRLKLALNEERYPVARSKGNALKHEAH